MSPPPGPGQGRAAAPPGHARHSTPHPSEARTKLAGNTRITDARSTPEAEQNPSEEGNASSEPAA